METTPASARIRVAARTNIKAWPSPIKINDVMTKLLSGNNDNIMKSPMGGVKTAAEILNFLGGNVENAIIDGVLRATIRPLVGRVYDEAIRRWEVHSHAA